MDTNLTELAMSAGYRTIMALLALTVWMAITGCTCAGYGVGALVDTGKDDYRPVERQEIALVEPGKELVVHMEDGTTRAGAYAGRDDRRDTVQIQYEGITEAVALEQVVRVEVRNDKHGKTWGLWVGAAIDVGIFIGMATYDWNSSGGTAYGSWDVP